MRNREKTISIESSANLLALLEELPSWENWRERAMMHVKDSFNKAIEKSEDIAAEA